MGKLLVTDKFQLRLERWSFDDQRIIGTLYFNDYPLCNTLENYACAIKADSYRCYFMPTPSWSRFCGVEGYEYQIRLEDKNGREGILFHVGNSAKDSKGCILVGSFMPSGLSSRREDWIYFSKTTYLNLCVFLRSLLYFCVIEKDRTEDYDSISFNLKVVNR